MLNSPDLCKKEKGVWRQTATILCSKYLPPSCLSHCCSCWQTLQRNIKESVTFNCENVLFLTPNYDLFIFIIFLSDPIKCLWAELTGQRERCIPMDLGQIKHDLCLFKVELSNIHRLLPLWQMFVNFIYWLLCMTLYHSAQGTHSLLKIKMKWTQKSNVL